MKTIDLLNKIANEEAIPEYICLYNENDEQFHTVLCCEENIVHYLDDKGLKLNDEIKLDEIEEEKKIPEKLNLDTDELRGKETPRAIDYLIESKINQVIDYLKSKGDE